MEPGARTDYLRVRRSSPLCTDDKTTGFEPTKRAISRIAKEGRKYGVSLAIISQRPAELDPTILSQCNTVFSMRLTNERDQDILRAGISDAAASLLEFMPTMGTGEAVTFGEGVSLPTRIKFDLLPRHALPKSSTASFTRNWAIDVPKMASSTPSSHAGACSPTQVDYADTGRDHAGLHLEPAVGTTAVVPPCTPQAQPRSRRSRCRTAGHATAHAQQMPQSMPAAATAPRQQPPMAPGHRPLPNRRRSAGCRAATIGRHLLLAAQEASRPDRLEAVTAAAMAPAQAQPAPKAGDTG